MLQPLRDDCNFAFFLVKLRGELSFLLGLVRPTCSAALLIYSLKMSISLVDVESGVITLGITITRGKLGAASGVVSGAAAVDVDFHILNFEPIVTLSSSKLDSSKCPILLLFTPYCSTICFSFLIDELRATLKPNYTCDIGILAGCLTFKTGTF